MNHRQRLILMVFSLILIITLGAGAAGFIGNDNDSINVAIILPEDSERDLALLMAGIRDAASTEDIRVNIRYAQDWTENHLQDEVGAMEREGMDALLLAYPERYTTGIGSVSSLCTLVLTDAKTDRDDAAVYPSYTGSFQSTAVSDANSEQNATSYSQSGKVNVDRLRSVVLDKGETILLPNAYKMGYECMTALKTAAITRKTVISPVGEDIVIDRESLADGRYDSLLAG